MRRKEWKAKPHFSIGKIIKEAELSNYHITDGGSVIINPIDNTIVKKVCDRIRVSV